MIRWASQIPYDTSDRLISANDSDDETVFTATYDARTRRLSKFESGDTTSFRYDGGTNFQELNGDGDVTKELVRAGGMGGGIGSILYTDESMRDTPGPVEFFTYNAVGNTVAVTDEDQDPTQTSEYDAFGETVTQTGASDNNRLRNTKERDSSIGLDNDGFRYYDPATATYVQRDPSGYGDGMNVYTSVHDNPVNGMDPQGLEGFFDAQGSLTGQPQRAPDPPSEFDIMFPATATMMGSRIPDGYLEHHTNHTVPLVAQAERTIAGGLVAGMGAVAALEGAAAGAMKWAIATTLYTADNAASVFTGNFTVTSDVVTKLTGSRELGETANFGLGMGLALGAPNPTPATSLGGRNSLASPEEFTLSTNSATGDIAPAEGIVAESGSKFIDPVEGMPRQPGGDDFSLQQEEQGTGYYRNTHNSGKTYSGKGDVDRMNKSANRIGSEHADPVASQQHTQAPNDRESFIGEQNDIEKAGGPGGNTYNKINSPGKRYRDGN